MKLKINRQELIEKLNVLERALPKRGYFAQLAGFHFNVADGVGTITTNNLDMGIQTSIEVDGEDGEIVLDNSLADIVEKLSGNEVSIEAGGNNAKVMCGKTKFTLQVLDVEEFPKPDEDYAGWAEVDFPGDSLKRLINKMAFCTSKDESKPVFKGIKFSPENVTSSDTHRLAQLDVATGADAIIPGKLMQELAKIPHQDAKAYIGENRVVFFVGGYKVYLSLLNGKYPDMGNIVPEKSKTEVMTDKEQLLQILGRAAVIAKDHNKLIEVTITQGLLKVEARSDTGHVEDEMEVDVKGEEVDRIYLNLNYLQEGVRSTEGDNVRIDFNGDVGPVIIKEADYINLILPIKKEV